jgi:hypothetical protein
MKNKKKPTNRIRKSQYINNLINQSSLDILPHGFPLSTTRLATHMESQYDQRNSSWAICIILDSGFCFCSTDSASGRCVCLCEPNRVGISPFHTHTHTHTHLTTETDVVYETLCSVEYRTMDKARKPSNPERYAPSSEAFSIYYMLLSHHQKAG